MNCDWVQQNITLYLYNELADDAPARIGAAHPALQSVRRRAGRASRNFRRR